MKSRKVLASLLVLFLLMGTLPGAPTAAAPSISNTALGEEAQQATLDVLRSAPLMFIENVGQSPAGARFQVRGGDRTIWLAEDAIWITVLETPPQPSPTSGREHFPPLTGGLRGVVDGRIERGEPRRGVNLKLSFPGANPHPRLEPFDRLDTHISYFIGNDPDQWRPDVPVWAGVRYVDLYPGVDLEVTGEGGRWIWRLICGGADCQSALRSVRLRVEGADGVELLPSPSGRGAGGEGLRLTTAVGEFTLPLLAVEGAMPNGQPATFNLEPGTFGVTFPFSRPSQSLSVSMQDNPDDLLYSTFLGGSGEDYGNGIAVDASGAAYVAGGTYSTDFPTTPGAFDTTYNGGGHYYADAFVVKLNAAGSTLAYATFLGGSDWDCGYGIAVDSSGAAYVMGETWSSDFPTTPGAFDISHGGGTCGTAPNTYPCPDAFVLKLNPTGSALAYATFLGGDATDQGKGIAVDVSGAAYVAGWAGSFNFPTTPGAFDTTRNGGSDAFVVKLNATGSALAYATFLGGSLSDFSSAVAVDGNGAAYVTGWTNSSDFPTTAGAFDRSFNGGGDTFVARLNSTGSALAYATFLGGNDWDWGRGIAVDGSGAAYVTGQTDSSDFPTTAGAFDPSHNGGGDDGTDAFVVKLNTGGTHLAYATFIGGSDDDYSRAIGVDGVGSAYVMGRTWSFNFPTTAKAFDTSHNGYSDGFVIKLNAGGTELAYATFMGGSHSEWGSAIAMDEVGSVYVTGETSSSDFPTTPYAFDTTFNGYADAFVVKLTFGIVTEARLDIGMPYPPYPRHRGCPSDYVGCGGPYHGFYLGVCTDLAMDAYNWGVPFNLQNALYQDHLVHQYPPRYQWGSARNAEDMRRYFEHNQQLLPHSQAYQPGDIAFFDWPGDGLGSCNHVAIISKVDADGRPLRMVHATDICLVNPGGLAFEETWRGYYDQYVQGHGRLSGIGASAMAADETLQILRITLDSPSMALRLLDVNGKSTSSSYVESLIALNNEAAIPYIPSGTYADLGTEKVITVTQPLSNTAQYFVELTGQADTTYHLRIETLQDSSVTDSQVFTQAISAGDTHGSTITLSAPAGTIEFSATSPSPCPKSDIPDSVELVGLAGTPAQATFTVAETGGQQSLQNVVVSATDLMDQLGGTVSGSLLTITPDSFSVPAGSSQNVGVQISLVNVAPGTYLGGLVIRSDNGGTRMIPLTLENQFHHVYLPTIFKNH